MININNSVIRYNYNTKMFNFREIFEKHFSLITNSKLEYTRLVKIEVDWEQSVANLIKPLRS